MKPGNHLSKDRNGANSCRLYLADGREGNMFIFSPPCSGEFFRLVESIIGQM